MPGESLSPPSTAPLGARSQSSNYQERLPQIQRYGRDLSLRRAFSPVSTTHMSCLFSILWKRTACVCWSWSCFLAGQSGTGLLPKGSHPRRPAQRCWPPLPGCRQRTKRTFCTEM